MTILVEFEDGRGISQDALPIFINPELVCGVQPDRNGSTTVFTTAYNWLVKGDVKEVATKLMLPDILTRAGVSLEMLDELEKLTKEQRNADASKE
jgi:hypothetical protein